MTPPPMRALSCPRCHQVLMLINPGDSDARLLARLRHVLRQEHTCTPQTQTAASLPHEAAICKANAERKEPTT